MNVHVPAAQISISDLIAEYDAKVNGGEITRTNPDGTLDVTHEYVGVDAEIAIFDQACSNLSMACRLGAGIRGESIWGRGGRPEMSADSLKKGLLISAWREVYRGLNIPKIAPVGDRQRFEQMLTDPPSFTKENIREQFGPYLLDPRQHILRGLAEQFAKLDPWFKSHERMKIGVKGLPKRIIVSCLADSYGHGADQLRDVLNALMTYLERPQIEYTQWARWYRFSKGVNEYRAKVRYSEGDLVEHDGKVWIAKCYTVSAEAFDPECWTRYVNPLPGLELRIFKNGNGHLHFDKEMQDHINRALHEYYGEVLADCPEERPEAKRKSTAVSKDLAFYPTPPSVVDQLLARAICDGALPFTRNREPKRIRLLEPSCGEGAIIEGVVRVLSKPPESYRYDSPPKVSCAGYEVDPTRAEITRRKGFGVMVANFLEIDPRPEYDLILMNPPFCGKHYQQHVDHAKQFLKPGGALYAILPVTAVTDHGYVKPNRNGWLADRWHDLPVGSFSESGTNINTGIYRYIAAGGGQ